MQQVIQVHMGTQDVEANFQFVREFVGHKGSVSALSFQPKNGKVLASCSGDETVRLWDPVKGTQLKELKVGAEYWIRNYIDAAILFHSVAKFFMASFNGLKVSTRSVHQIRPLQLVRMG